MSIAKRVTTWLWPTWPGVAVPGLWLAYIIYAAVEGRFHAWADVPVALWPVLPLYAGSCLLAAWQRRGGRARFWLLVAVAAALALADLAVKAWIEARLPLHQPQPLIPGLLSITRTHNIYGTMLAIPGAKPFVTILAIVLVPASLWGYRHYVTQEQPVSWGHAAFVGLLAGALAKAGDLLVRRLIVDYLHIPNLPIADLADIYLLWLGAGCTLAASLWRH